MNIGQPERATQNRVIALFRDELGYRTLGDWTDRTDNSNIEEKLLTDYLTKSGYSAADMDAELASLTQRRDKTRALKQGMMQELLTGRTRLI